MREVKEKSSLKERAAETLKSAPQAAFRRGADAAFRQLRQELREAAQDGQMEDRYGKKYCKDSLTVEEAALHGAVVRALNRFHAEDESTYLTLMKATIGEAIGINGGSEEIDLLTRRIDTLNKRMLDLVNETVAAGKDVESSEDEFKGISDQIEQLNRRIAAIQESIHKDGSRQARLEEIQSIITNRNANGTQYDDSIVRQMIECIKVHNNGKVTIIFGGGYEIKETL